MAVPNYSDPDWVATLVTAIQGIGALTTAHGEELAHATALSVAGTGAPVSVPFVRTSGDALLDYTAPTAPKVVNAGVYAVHVVVTDNDAADAGKHFTIDLTAGNVESKAGANQDEAVRSASVTKWFAANATFALTIAQDSGVGTPHSFGVLCTVERLA